MGNEVSVPTVSRDGMNYHILCTRTFIINTALIFQYRSGVKAKIWVMTPCNITHEYICFLDFENDAFFSNFIGTNVSKLVRLNTVH